MPACQLANLFQLCNHATKLNTFKQQHYRWLICRYCIFLTRKQIIEQYGGIGRLQVYEVGSPATRRKTEVIKVGGSTREVLFTKEEILSIFGWYFSMRPFMGTQFLDPLLKHLHKDSYLLTELMHISHDWFHYEPFVYDAIETYSGWDISFLEDEGAAKPVWEPSDPLFYLVSRAVNYVNVTLNEKDWQIFQIFSDVFAEFGRDLVASCENGTVSLHCVYNHFRQAVGLVQELQAEILKTQGYDYDAALKFLHCVEFPAYEIIFPKPKPKDYATLKELPDWDAVDGPYCVVKDVMQVFFRKLPMIEGGTKVDASFFGRTYLQELKDAVAAVEPVPTDFDESRFNKADNLRMEESHIIGSYRIGRHGLSFYNDFKKAYKEFKDNYEPLQDSKPCNSRMCRSAHRLEKLFDEGQRIFPDSSVRSPEFADALTLWNRFKSECEIKRAENEQDFFNKFALSARSGGRRQESKLYRFLDSQLSRYYDFGPESSTVRRQLGKVINTWWERIVFAYRYNDKNEIRDMGSGITENFFSDLKFVGNMAKHLKICSFSDAVEFDWLGPGSPLMGWFQEHVGKSWQFFIENSINFEDKKEGDEKAFYFAKKKGTTLSFKPGQVLFELLYLYWLLSVHFRAGDDWAGLTRCILLSAGFNGLADDFVLLDSK